MPILLTIGAFLLLVLFRYSMPVFLGNIVMIVGTPVIVSTNYVASASLSVLDVFSSKKAIEEENRRLKDELTQLQVAIDRDKLLVQENTDLKELLGRHADNNSILATVIAKPPISLYDTIVLDVGADKKISIGDKVLALGIIPIGTINAVYTHTSVAKLFSSSGEQVDVRIGKNIQSVAQAQGGGNFLIKLPKGTEIKEGDPIAAPGIDADVFGSVDNIETNENDPFLYVRFSLPINISELNFVQVDRNNAI